VGRINSAHRGTARKRGKLTHKSCGDNNVTTKNPQLNTTMGITGRKVRKREERTVSRSGQKVNTTVVSNGGADLQELPTECAMLVKGLAKLVTTPIGNVQLGKTVATTHHQGRHHQSVGHAKKGNSQATMTTAVARYGEPKWTTLHRIPPKIPPKKHKREEERGK